MQKILPQVIIAGTAFLIDAAKEELRDAADTGNSIPFDKLKDEGGYFTMLYDVNSKNIWTNLVAADEKNDHLRKIILPALILSKNQAISDELARSINQQSSERNWGIYAVNGKLARRLAGELPGINIDGSRFIVDWRLKELRDANDVSRKIDLSRLDMNEEGTEYVCLYNTKSKEVIYNAGAYQADDHVAILRIPYELKLDPVAVARQYGLKETELLEKFPMQEVLNARLEPIGNRIRQSQKIQQKNKQQKLRSGKRKGKRL